jgi:hypothetical protein
MTPSITACPPIFFTPLPLIFMVPLIQPPGQKKTGNRDGFLPASCRYVRLLLCVFFLELLDPALSVNNLLLAGIERMALRADIEMDFGSRRPGCIGLTACAADLYLFVFGMNSLLQFPLPPEMRCFIVSDFRLFWQPLRRV